MKRFIIQRIQVLVIDASSKAEAESFMHWLPDAAWEGHARSLDLHCQLVQEHADPDGGAISPHDYPGFVAWSREGSSSHE